MTPTTAKEAGLSAARQSAASNGPEWAATALCALQVYAAQSTQPFTIEQARTRLDGTVPAPKDGRARGAVTHLALRRNLIRKTGQYAPALSSHGAPKALYAGV